MSPRVDMKKAQIAQDLLNGKEADALCLRVVTHLMEIAPAAVPDEERARWGAMVLARAAGMLAAEGMAEVPGVTAELITFCSEGAAIAVQLLERAAREMPAIGPISHVMANLADGWVDHAVGQVGNLRDEAAAMAARPEGRPQ